MSKIKHNSYRKILSISTQIDTIQNVEVKTRIVLWCVPISTTSRTVKSKHVCVSVYINGKPNWGINARMPQKAVSINLKHPENSKCFEKWNLNQMIQEATSGAFRQYILNTPALSKNVTGTVLYFFDTKGVIKTTLGTFSVYACNIQGAKTWYPETACMFLKKGETVQFDLSDVGDYLTPSKVRGNVYFDAEKWNSLDQSKLAFKCDENGNATTGLFQTKAV